MDGYTITQRAVTHISRVTRRRLMQQAAIRRRLDGGHMLPLPAVLERLLAAFGWLRYDVRILLVAVALACAAVVLRYWTATCGKKVRCVRLCVAQGE